MDGAFHSDTAQRYSAFLAMYTRIVPLVDAYDIGAVVGGIAL
jgi:hypothetical protein